MITTVDPTTAKALASYESIDRDTALTLAGRAASSFESWRERPFEERAAGLRRIAARLREDADRYAMLMAEEMGKPLRQGRSEAEKCAWVCEYYAEHGESFLAAEQISSDATRSTVHYRPLGVVLAIMPWNFPFWQVFRFAAPALMAGNTALLKHATNVTGCALELEKLFREAFADETVLQALVMSRDDVAAVIEHPAVRAVSLTGSTRAGASVAATAGAAIKRSVLELGGSDPYLVLHDAELEETVDTCVQSRLINSGQSCIAAKRFLVVEAVREEFEQRFCEKMAGAAVGDPQHEGTEVGPQARADLRDDLDLQVRESVDAGARLLLGGELPDREGFFYPPTVLTDVSPGMPAFDEEVFGPVAAIVPVADEEEAVALANRSDFGLGAAVFTADTARGEELATTRLEAGACFVNDFVKSDPRLPFGGVKASGYGRELGPHGIKEFVNVKTVSVG